MQIYRLIPFLKRVGQGEIYSAELAEQSPNRDWILTRILWLSGCEVGKNRGGNCDTMRRYIYIHGTPDSERWVFQPHMVVFGCVIAT